MLKEHGHAEKTFKNVDEAMQSYYYLTGEQLKAFPPEPQLYDFMQEDDNSAIKNKQTNKPKTKNTEIALVGAGKIITGYLTYKFV